MKNTMDDVETKDLQVWARENKIWRKESWGPFLENLEKLHSMLTEFWEFHKWLRGTFNNKRISLLPEELKNPARLIVAGGGRDDNAFARMMFNLFDVKAAGASTYDESVTIYEGRGDGTRILVGQKVLGINENDIKNALRDLERVVEHFKQQLGTSESRMHKEDFKKWVNPENPKIIEKLNEFLNLAANMLEPTNPYVLFVRYLNVASLGIIIDFLGCDIGGARSLAELLEAQIYDSGLNLLDIRDINGENVNDLFWILSPYNSSIRPVSRRILSLFGEDGIVHMVIKRMYPDIDEKFKELWEQRFHSLVKLKESNRWALLKELRIFLGTYSRDTIKKVCKSNNYAILLIKPLNGNRAEIDIGGWEWNSLSRYPCNPKRTIKTEYPIIIPIEDLFPLFATNYLQAWTDDNSKTHGIRICRFLAVRPTRCRSRYKDGKDSYLELIKALGEIKNGDKTKN